MNFAGPTSVVAQGYTHDRMNVRRRPDASAESAHHFMHPDALSSGQHTNIQGLSGVGRCPVATDEAVRVVDQTGIRCETCLRPATYVCSACRKVSYCSVECQVCFTFCCLYYPPTGRRMGLKRSMLYDWTTEMRQAPSYFLCWMLLFISAQVVCCWIRKIIAGHGRVLAWLLVCIDMHFIWY